MFPMRNSSARWAGTVLVAAALGIGGVRSAAASADQTKPYWLGGGQFELVSTDAAGEPAVGPSVARGISDDGRYVLVWSWAYQSFGGPPGTNWYLVDRKSQTAQFVSKAEVQFLPFYVSETGDLTGDGRFVAYSRGSYSSHEVYVFDRITGSNTKVAAVPKVPIYDVSVNEAGSRVAVYAGGAAGGIYVFDTALGLGKIPVATPGGSWYGPQSQPRFLELSGDGRHLAYTSFNSSEIRTNIYDLATATDSLVDAGPMLDTGNQDWAGEFSTPSRPTISLSGDGRYLAFATKTSHSPRDQDAATDVYLFDQRTGTYRLASYSPGDKLFASNSSVDGAHSPHLSGDGTAVTFLVSSNDSNESNDRHFVRYLDKEPPLMVLEGVPDPPGAEIQISVELMNPFNPGDDEEFTWVERTFVADAGNEVVLTARVGTSDAVDLQVFAYDTVAKYLAKLMTAIDWPSLWPTAPVP